jgi:MFS family permease
MQNAIEVRDWRGRIYLVGPSATELLHRPRTWMLWSACAAMAAIAPMQYGYAALSPQLAAAQGLPLASTLIPLAVWLACQAITALATAILLSRGRLQAHSALRLGALLSGAALLTVAAAHPPALSGLPGSAAPAPAALPVPFDLIVGYGLLGGIGAGLVYGACTQTVARWYPDRPAIRVSVVTGAFAYGTIPLAVAVGLDHDLLGPAFLVAAGVAVIVVTAAASLLRTPPSLWWPPEVDPRAWALDRSVLHRQPRAARQFSLGEAARTRCLAVLALILVVAGAVGIFNVIAMAVTLDAVGPIMAVFIALMLLLNGSGRSGAILLAERFGRPRVLSLVLMSLGAGQALLALAGLAAQTEARLGAQAGAQIEAQTGVQAVVQAGVQIEGGGVPAAVQAGAQMGTAGAGTGAGLLAIAGVILAGIGSGACYPLIASLVREYFGDERMSGIHGVVYSAKAVAGSAGVGLAIWGSMDIVAAFLVAAALSIAAVGLCGMLRRPGLPATLPLRVL